MSEHELWNELGNLYFLSGSFEQAIHAYTRSIALDKNYGRPYGNLALAYVQKGRYTEAIDLYRRGIRLLTEDQEKAQCWYKLGNVYRHLKEYHQAVDAYQKADELAPGFQEMDDPGNRAAALLNRKPSAEDAILPDQEPAEPAPQFDIIPLPEELTPWFFDEQAVPEEQPLPAELECWFDDLEPAAVEETDNTLFAEPLQWELSTAYELAIVEPEGEPDPIEELAALPSASEEASTPMDLPVSLRESSVVVAETAEQEVPTADPAIRVDETPLPVAEPLAQEVPSLDLPILLSEAPLEVIEATVPEAPAFALPVRLNETALQVRETTVQEAPALQVETVVLEDEPAPLAECMPEMELIPEEITFQAEDVTSPAAVQYEVPTEVPVVEVPSVDLTPAERDAIEIDIHKFKRVLEINPGNAFAWDTIGGLYKSIGQYCEAILAYQKATSLDPTKAFYFHHLGLVYAAEGRYEDAIAAFQRVIEIDPNYSLAHATLGGYYRKRGMEELAQAHIGKAKSLLGADENEYNRACMEAICGNSDRALELLEIALKNKQTYVNWAKRDPDLDFIRSDPRFHVLLSEHATRPAR